MDDARESVKEMGVNESDMEGNTIQTERKGKKMIN